MYIYIHIHIYIYIYLCTLYIIKIYMEDLDQNSGSTMLFYTHFTESKSTGKILDHQSTFTILLHMQFIGSSAIRAK